jgi:hypothetical protein
MARIEQNKASWEAQKAAQPLQGISGIIGVSGKFVDAYLNMKKEKYTNEANLAIDSLNNDIAPKIEEIKANNPTEKWEGLASDLVTDSITKFIGGDNLSDGAKKIIANSNVIDKFRNGILANIRVERTRQEVADAQNSAIAYIEMIVNSSDPEKYLSIGRTLERTDGESTFNMISNETTFAFSPSEPEERHDIYLNGEPTDKTSYQVKMQLIGERLEKAFPADEGKRRLLLEQYRQKALEISDKEAMTTFMASQLATGRNDYGNLVTEAIEAYSERSDGSKPSQTDIRSMTALVQSMADEDKRTKQNSASETFRNQAYPTMQEWQKQGYEYTLDDLADLMEKSGIDTRFLSNWGDLYTTAVTNTKNVAVKEVNSLMALDERTEEQNKRLESLTASLYEMFPKDQVDKILKSGWLSEWEDDNSVVGDSGSLNMVNDLFVKAREAGQYSDTWNRNFDEIKRMLDEGEIGIDQVNSLMQTNLSTDGFWTQYLKNSTQAEKAKAEAEQAREYDSTVKKYGDEKLALEMYNKKGIVTPYLEELVDDESYRLAKKNGGNPEDYREQAQKNIVSGLNVSVADTGALIKDSDRTNADKMVSGRIDATDVVVTPETKRKFADLFTQANDAGLESGRGLDDEAFEEAMSKAYSAYRSGEIDKDTLDELFRKATGNTNFLSRFEQYRATKRTEAEEQAEAEAKRKTEEVAELERKSNIEQYEKFALSEAKREKGIPDDFREKMIEEEALRLAKENGSLVVNDYYIEAEANVAYKITKNAAEYKAKLKSEDRTASDIVVQGNVDAIIAKTRALFGESNATDTKNTYAGLSIMNMMSNADIPDADVSAAIQSKKSTGEITTDDAMYYNDMLLNRDKYMLSAPAQTGLKILRATLKETIPYESERIFFEESATRDFIDQMQSNTGLTPELIASNLSQKYKAKAISKSYSAILKASKKNDFKDASGASMISMLNDGELGVFDPVSLNLIEMQYGVEAVSRVLGDGAKKQDETETKRWQQYYALALAGVPVEGLDVESDDFDDKFASLLSETDSDGKTNKQRTVSNFTANRAYAFAGLLQELKNVYDDNISMFDGEDLTYAGFEFTDNSLLFKTKEGITLQVGKNGKIPTQTKPSEGKLGIDTTKFNKTAREDVARAIEKALASEYANIPARTDKNGFLVPRTEDEIRQIVASMLTTRIVTEFNATGTVSGNDELSQKLRAYSESIDKVNEQYGSTLQPFRFDIDLDNFRVGNYFNVGKKGSITYTKRETK